MDQAVDDFTITDELRDGARWLTCRWHLSDKEIQDISPIEAGPMVVDDPLMERLEADRRKANKLLHVYAGEAARVVVEESKTMVMWRENHHCRWVHLLTCEIVPIGG